MKVKTGRLIVLGLTLILLALLFGQVLASPIVTIIPTGQFGIMECEPGSAPAPSVSHDGQWAIMVCHNAATSERSK